MSTSEKIKGVILLSGGLDSVLAAHLLTQLKIELIAINYTSPFHPEPVHPEPVHSESAEGINFARVTADRLGIPLRQINFSKYIIDIIKNPEHGYGKNLNPCIDCRIAQLKVAKKIMKEEGCAFIVTGEVTGQRPMSQNKNSLELIEKAAGVKRILLRPLSAKLLPTTLPEEKGLINRNKLLKISGRSRKEQLALADKFHISKEEYLPAAGGCRLTNKEYASKIRDLKEHNILNINNVVLANKGRHFRISPEFKLIVGRDEKENNILRKSCSEHHECQECSEGSECPKDSSGQALLITPSEIPGPLSVGIFNFNRNNS
ncbi:MAG: hypothetical protein PF545_01190, partial [Elusimicrobia bacterium]|nr:hypothetical protein [Elusimicrobiota bacterium]